MALERTAGTLPPTARLADEPVAVIGRRMSWGAVAAGVITALAVHLLMSLLGVAIGASSIDPLLGESPDAATLGIGAGIWWVASALVAVFAGGWVAGRLAGVPVRADGMLHGFLTWGLTTLLLFYILTTTLSSLLGGAFGLVGSALTGTARGAQELADDRPGRATGVAGDIERQLQAMLGQAVPGLDRAGQQLGRAVEDENVRAVVRKVIAAGPDGLSAGDREQAINALVSHGSMTRPQAEQQLAAWEQAYRDTEQRAREAGEITADRVSQASVWLFVSLALGAAVAGFGGLLGTPRDLPLRPAVRG